MRATIRPPPGSCAAPASRSLAAPTVGEVVDVTTWASGSGRCWAERRTTITGDAGGQVETVSLWIFLDPVTGRPTRLTQDFHDTWGEATGGRKVPARNLLGPPPDGLAGRRWPLRSTDLDGLGHVNNAATWAPVEDELDRIGRHRPPRRSRVRRRHRPRRRRHAAGDRREPWGGAPLADRRRRGARLGGGRRGAGTQLIRPRFVSRTRSG